MPVGSAKGSDLESANTRFFQAVEDSGCVNIFYNRVENRPKTHYKQRMKPAPTKITNIASYRVIYGDTDQMGVVYYANYLRWFEKGRSEFLRQIGLPYSVIEQQGFNFPVVEVTCRYAQSARYDDVIRIETELTEVGRAALSFSYRICAKATVAAIWRAARSTKHASIDSAGRVSRMPKTLLEALEQRRGLAGRSRDFLFHSPRESRRRSRSNFPIVFDPERRSKASRAERRTDLTQRPSCVAAHQRFFVVEHANQFGHGFPAF